MRKSIQFCNSWFRDVPAVPAVPAVQQELVGPVGALGPQGLLGALGLLQLPGLSALVELMGLLGLLGHNMVPRLSPPGGSVRPAIPRGTHSPSHPASQSPSPPP